jgi:hypothetical protein
MEASDAGRATALGKRRDAYATLASDGAFDAGRDRAGEQARRLCYGGIGWHPMWGANGPTRYLFIVNYGA